MSDVVARVAMPLAFNATAPKTVAPSLKVTVPVGVPLVASVTLAVNVTDCWNEDGLTEALTVVEVPALFTVCASAGEVLALKLVFPE